MQKGKDPESFDELFVKMKSAIKKSSLLTKRFMNFSKDQSAQTKQLIDIKVFTEDICTLLKSGFVVDLKFKIQEELPHILFDESQLYQVINNLVLNAKQASDDNAKILVTVSDEELIGHESLQDGVYIKMEVKDNGMGITPEDLGNIFKSYFTTKETGNGLGLSSCKSILKMSGGDIFVQSEMGIGTVFSLFIPIAKENKDPFIFTKELITGKGLIYLVDDDINLRQTTQKQIQGIGYDVKSFSSGEEMLQVFLEEKCDLLITDYYLLEKHLNGDEICESIQEVVPSLPVILLSGFF